MVRAAVNILFIIEGDWLKGPTFDMHILAEAMSLLCHKVYAIDYAHRRRDGFLGLGSLRTKEFDGVAHYFPRASVCLRSPGLIRIPYLGRLSAAFTHYLEIARTIREKDIDVIVLNSIPTSGLQTIHLAKKFNIPVVFRFLDILHVCNTR